MDVDDTFIPDNAWSTTVHDNDYSDADSQRMDPADFISPADWSNPTQENAPRARPAGEPATAFRLDQLFNYGGTVEYQNGELDLPGEPPPAPGPATPPAPAGPTRCWPSSRPPTRPPASPTQTTSAGSATPTTPPTWTWAAPPRTTSKPS